MNPVIDQLNDAYEALSDRLNLVGEGVSASVVNASNAAIADWQDWYWGNYEEWDLSELPGLITAYNDTKNALTTAEREHGQLEREYEDPAPAPGQPSEAIVLEEQLVTAKRPWWYWALWVGAAVIAIYTIKTIAFGAGKKAAA